MDSITDGRKFDLDDTGVAPRKSPTDGLTIKEYVGRQLSRLNAVIPCFGDEPDYADLHESRFIAWQLGMTYTEITEAESGASITPVSRSVNYNLMRLPMVEQIQARNNHTISRAHNEHSDKYFEVLKGLLEEKSWMARSQALKHFRKTVALEGTSVVTVNVDNRKQTANNFGGSGKGSFEGAMDRVRRMHREEDEIEEQKRLEQETVRFEDQVDQVSQVSKESIVLDAEILDVDKF